MAAVRQKWLPEQAQLLQSTGPQLRGLILARLEQFEALEQELAAVLRPRLALKLTALC